VGGGEEKENPGSGSILFSDVWFYVQRENFTPLTPDFSHLAVERKDGHTPDTLLLLGRKPHLLPHLSGHFSLLSLLLQKRINSRFRNEIRRLRGRILLGHLGFCLVCLGLWFFFLVNARHETKHQG
jgi:hypothetical protein